MKDAAGTIFKENDLLTLDDEARVQACDGFLRDIKAGRSLEFDANFASSDKATAYFVKVRDAALENIWARKAVEDGRFGGGEPNPREA